jgi:hypothetical protein
MPLSKEFYLDEIKSKYPNSYNESLKDLPIKDLEDMLDFLEGALSKADGGSIGIEVLFGPKRGEYQTGGPAYDSRATAQDYANALKSVSAGTTYQQQADAKRYARNQANQILTNTMRSGNQANIQNLLQQVGGITSIPGMQFNRSGNRITTIPATGPGRDKILNALANQMLSTTSYAPPPPRDPLGLLMSETFLTGKMKSIAEMDALRDKVLAAQKAQEQSYFMTDPVTGKRYSSETEAIDDLGLVTYNQRFADGGRVGLFMGGDPLTGQALQIFNAMKNYNFTDQEIADVLSARGLSEAASSGTTTSDAPTTIQPIGYQGRGDDNPYAGQVVDQTDYSFNKKNYAPGEKLEINPAAVGMSFYDAEPKTQNKDKGFIGRTIDSFMGAAVPGKQLSQFTSPGTGDILKGPAELGFMSQNIEGIPGNLTREDLRSMYDNYNKFLGRPSNFVDARVKGTAGNLINTIPYIGTIKKGAEALFGPQGDKSLQSKYTVDGAGFGSTGGRDEFGLATFNKKDGFLGLTGNTTRNYVDRMQDKLNDLEDFFGSRIDGFDINNLDPATLSKMKGINSFYTKQIQAYQQRLATENLNEQIRKQKEQEELQKKIEAEIAAGKSYSQIGRENFTGEGMAFAPRTDTFTGGKTVTLSDGRQYSSPKKDGGLMFAKGGLATMFKRKR